MKRKLENLILVLVSAGVLTWPQLGLTGTSEDDWEQIADTLNDGVTVLDLDSDGATIDLHWGLVNEEGVLSLRTHSTNILDDVGVERMTLLRDGRVGIGTTAPARSLSVFGFYPQFRSSHNGAPDDWEFGHGFTGFWFERVSEGGVLKLQNSAPVNALVVDGTGVGIGTASPSEAVDVQRSAAAARFQLTSFSSTGNEAPQFVQRRALGTSGAPAAVTAGDNLGLFSFRGHTGSGFTGTKAGITVKATEPWSGSANGTRMLFQTTTNGTTTLNTVLEITHDSKVKINGTELNVPDYVFEEDYQLMPLEELDAFIREYKHLPGVASAEEVKRDGLDLGGSQLSVLEKVEELTLYTLQQHEQLKALRTENAQLRSAYGSLQTRLTKVDQLEQMVNLLMQGEKSSPLLTSVSE